MDCRISELQYKEVVDITDGTRYGYIGDLELDVETGAVRSVIITGKGRCLGLLGRQADAVFPWSSIKRIGADIILVDSGGTEHQTAPFHPEKSQFFLKKK